MTYSVGPYDAVSAREAILELWRRNFPDALPDRYAWLYESGPASGFVLRTDEGRAVGATGLMRRDFTAFGKTLKAAQAIDLNVDRNHRTIGPALRLQRAVLAAVESGEVDLAYGFPNSQSEAVLGHVGYQTLGSLERWVKPLSCSVGFDHLGWPRWLARSSAVLLDPIFSRKFSEVLYRRPRTIRVCEADSFDARFDQLWQTAGNQFPILGERTSAYLNWRFCQCPGQRYRVLGITDANGQLLAYLVHGRSGEAAYVADLLFADGRYLGPLLAEFLRLVRRDNVRKVVLLYLGRSDVSQALVRFGFWRRPSGRKAMVYIKKGDRAPFLDLENWHLTSADIDTDG